MMYHAVLGCYTKHMQQPPPSLFPLPLQPSKLLYGNLSLSRIRFFLNFELPTLGPFSPFFAWESTPDPRNRILASTPDPRAMGREVQRAVSVGTKNHDCALPIPAPNLGEVIPLPFFPFWCRDDRFLKNSTLIWCGDRPRGGSKGVIPCFRKLAFGGASWYLCF